MLLVIISGCGKSKVVSPPPPENSNNNNTENEESRLIFKNITLEQANPEGQTLWKIKAEQASYSQDKKIAQLENLSGNLYQDGEIVLKVSAAKGKIEQNGEIVWLEDEIIAIDQRNAIEIKCQQAQWRPQENLLMVHNQIMATHPKLKVSAKEGKYLTKEEKLDISGQILGKSNKPPIQFKTEHLIWNIKQELILVDVPLDIERYQNTTVTDRLQAQKGEINLKTEIARLENNVELNSLEPSLQMATKSASWHLNSRIVTTETPIQIIDKEQQITVTGNKGKVDLEEQIAYLNSGVTGENTNQEAKLYSNYLTWNMKQEMFTAEGNVIYQQTNPQFVATGSKAVGKLTEKSMVVTSSKGERVVTEIIPE